MKVTEHIATAKGKTIFSFEILPPLKGQNIQTIYDAIDPLIEFDPKFIEVTAHRKEINYLERGEGLLEKRIVHRRPGTVGICAAIQNKYKVDAVPHILCGGMSREDTENLLVDLDFLEIENVLALRGDASKQEIYFKPHKEGNAFAADLVKQINDLNQGKYLDESLKDPVPTHFEIGVAGYPEKHMEAPSLTQDLEHLKAKVNAGASYVVTQMFFDNQKYFNFVKKCREIGIHCPIIPGLKPLSTKAQLSMIPHRFSIELPDELVKEVTKAKDNKEVNEIGIEWCIEQSKDLMANGAPCLHYYTMGRSRNIRRIVQACF